MALAESITAKVVALAVIVLVIVSVAIPVIQDSQEQQVTIENNTSVRYMAMESNTATFENIDGVPTMNGQAVGDIFSDVAHYWAISDGLVVHCEKTSGALWTAWTAYYWDDENSVSVKHLIGAGESLVFTAGVVTLYDDEETATFTTTYTYFLLPSSEGKYGVYAKSDLLSESVYVDSSSTIYLATYGSSAIFTTAHGKLNDMDVDVATTSGNVAIENPTLTCVYEPTEDGKSNVLTNFDGNVTMNVSTYVFVPLAYTTLSSDNVMMTSLLSLVSILLILVPVMFAVRMLGAGRS